MVYGAHLTGLRGRLGFNSLIALPVPKRKGSNKNPHVVKPGSNDIAWTSVSYKPHDYK